MKKVVLQQLTFLFILAFIICLLLEYMIPFQRKYIIVDENLDLDLVTDFNITSASIHSIEQYCLENDLDFIKFLSAYMAYNHYEVDSPTYDYDRSYYKDVNYPKSIEKIYSAILLDLKYFPIPTQVQSTPEYWYTNSWEAERSYGGDRKHYGTDIIDSNNKRGDIPIVSMTDGTIENIGWLELGGWRIGIRTQRGAYFYYAHLNRYEEGLHQGADIKAGQVIGYMGDSGYGAEGTIGKFPVHLHLGISLPINNNEDETWINPYWILRYIQNNKVNL